MKELAVLGVAVVGLFFLTVMLMTVYQTIANSIATVLGGN